MCSSSGGGNLGDEFDADWSKKSGRKGKIGMPMCEKLGLRGRLLLLLVEGFIGFTVFANSPECALSISALAGPA
jgi:hypothetical protein